MKTQWSITKSLLCAFAGELIIIGILIISPDFRNILITISEYIWIIKTPIIITLIIISGLLFQTSVKRAKT